MHPVRVHRYHSTDLQKLHCIIYRTATEPACGIGNFFGLLPEEMSESKLYGIELDGISGRIAKLLYPNAEIRVTGYEKTHFPEGFFDIAIGNVPYKRKSCSPKSVPGRCACLSAPPRKWERGPTYRTGLSHYTTSIARGAPVM